MEKGNDDTWGLMKQLKKKGGGGGAKKVTEERPLLGQKLKKKKREGERERKHLNYTAAEATGDMWM